MQVNKEEIKNVAHTYTDAQIREFFLTKKGRKKLLEILAVQDCHSMGLPRKHAKRLKVEWENKYPLFMKFGKAPIQYQAQ